MGVGEMALTSSASRSFPTFRYLAAPFRWFFGSRRRVLTAAAVLLAMIAAPVIWWFVQLLGLPDIGDPFDVQAFRSFTIPEDRNAFVLYQQAADRLKPLVISSQAKEQRIQLSVPWSEADPLVRRWVEANREAMEIYRRGTKRPDALDPELASNPDSHKMTQALRFFQSLALLEASRLEEQGDMLGAWDWYRAALRATHHLSLRGTVPRRMNADRWHGEIRRRILGWTADPRRTTPEMIRRALDDALACGAFAPSDSYTLKLAYPLYVIELDRPENPGRQRLIVKLTAKLSSQTYQPDSDHIKALADAWRFWRREPERSRRVMALAFANWIAYEDLPRDRRPGPGPDVSGPIALYALGPEAPARARALAPAAFDRWLNTADEARELLGSWQLSGRPLGARERAGHRELVVLLASELYRRDHGTYPPSDEALVGTYLKSLPDEGADEATDRNSTRQERSR
jgi:hypothetical protein